MPTNHSIYVLTQLSRLREAAAGAGYALTEVWRGGAGGGWLYSAQASKTDTTSPLDMHPYAVVTGSLPELAAAIGVRTR
jgi:hypothetical protein